MAPGPGPARRVTRVGTLVRAKEGGEDVGGEGGEGGALVLQKGAEK